MKHIKKKYLVKHDITKDSYEYLINVPENKKVTNELKQKGYEGYYGLIVTDTNELIQSFDYKKDQKIHFIPEPNPILMYFSNAQIFLKRINDERNKLFKILNTENQNIHDITNTFYDFFGISSNFVVSLFNSLEAFVNSIIPDEFEYKRELNQKTELFNKEQIQKEISIEEKIKNIIPKIKAKSFHQTFSHKYEIIMNLKKYRDNIVHTKVFRKDFPNYYKVLYTTSLDFDYTESINVVKEFINFYEPNLIEQCDCGMDF